MTFAAYQMVRGSSVRERALLEESVTRATYSHDHAVGFGINRPDAEAVGRVDNYLQGVLAELHTIQAARGAHKHFCLGGRITTAAGELAIHLGGAMGCEAGVCDARHIQHVGHEASEQEQRRDWQANAHGGPTAGLQMVSPVLPTGSGSFVRWHVPCTSPQTGSSLQPGAASAFQRRCPHSAAEAASPVEFEPRQSA